MSRRKGERADREAARHTEPFIATESFKRRTDPDNPDPPKRTNMVIIGLGLFAAAGFIILRVFTLS